MIKKLLLVAAILGGVLTKTKAQVGAALNFDGTNDFVSLPALYAAEYTIETWVKLNTLVNRNIIAGTSSAGPSTALGISLRVNASGKFEHLTFDGSNKILQSPVTLTTGTWYHVAISAKSGGDMKIVVNGNETISTSTIGLLWTGLTTFRLGENTMSGFNYFDGEMDEFRVWNRQLCIDEIINNKDGEITTTAPRLVTNYHFNQGTAGGTNTSITSATDDSGYGKNGTLSNFALSGTTSNWIAPGAVTSGVAVTPFVFPTICGTSKIALNFNGTDDQLNTGILYSALTSNWTLECWAKGAAIPNTTKHNGPMYGKNMGIVWDHGNNTFAGGATVQDASLAYYAASFGSLLANTWYHLAATYDGTVLRAYKNGVLTSSVTTLGGLANATGGLTLGRHPTLNEFWNGTMDEARVWTVARTCSEINQSMNTELTGSETGLKAYYKFNEGTPEAINTTIPNTEDDSGNNYDCSLAGFSRAGLTSNYLVGAPFNNTINPSCLITGINEINTTSTFLIYPNPAHSVLNIETEQQTTILIVNVLGEIVKTETFHGTYKLDLSNLSTGVYFIQDAKSGKATKFIRE